jgi:hypothetical protein
MRAVPKSRARGQFRVRFPYKAWAIMTLICPKCQGGTELRGTMDAYYFTWCRECARLWRIELWTLVHGDEANRKTPWTISR